MKTTLTRNGEIKVDGNKVGNYIVHNLWKNGRRDLSGNLKVHYLWEFKLDNGYNNLAYSRTEVVDEVIAHI